MFDDDVDEDNEDNTTTTRADNIVDTRINISKEMVR